MAFVDTLVAQVLRGQVALWQAQARLQAATDSEALHDLRIDLRRLRSLLRPLRRHPCLAPVEAAAAELGQLTTPLRDLEVLLEQLQQQGLVQAAAARQVPLQDGYATLRSGALLTRLLMLLDDLPQAVRDAAQQGQLAGSKAHVRDFLHKQRRQLRKALADPAFDRHRLRLLTKRVRYANEMHARLSPLSTAAMAALKQLQGALGNWHDLDLWCQLADHEADLQVMQAHWQQAATAALVDVESAQQALARHLGKR